ncbi:MAG: hypothetical protein HC898_06670 [Phycisphaerales bacterium]|nr:hypothetical protein [Phycisphaerales bacterium]
MAVKPAPAQTAAPAAPVAVAPAKPVETPAVTEVKPVAPAPVAKPVEAPKADPDLLAQAKLLFIQQKLVEGREAEKQGNLRVALRSYDDGLAVDATQKICSLASKTSKQPSKLPKPPEPCWILR